MKMIKKSNYVIDIAIKDNQYLLIHGYNGNISILDNNCYQLFQDNIYTDKQYSDIQKDCINQLVKKGFLTKMDDEEELEDFCRVADKIDKIYSQYFTITFLPSYSCNFACPYCFERETVDHTDKCSMSIELAKDIFSYIDKSDKKIKMITLFGGEPLLLKNRKVIEFICNQCSSRNININIVTNGYCITQFLDTFKKSPIKNIQITFDGTEKIHNKTRILKNGGSTYEVIVNNIDILLSNGIPVTVRTNIGSENYNEIENLIDFYIQRNWVNNEYFDFYFTSLHKCYSSEEKLYSKIAIQEKVSKLLNEKGIVKNLKNDIIMPALKGGVPIYKTSYCSAVNSMLCIDPYGDIYPCWESVSNDKHKIGQIQKGEFILNNNYNLWQSRKVYKMETCKKCKYALFCGGGCPMHSMVEGKKFTDQYCDDFEKEFFQKVKKEFYTYWSTKYDKH